MSGRGRAAWLLIFGSALWLAGIGLEALLRQGLDQYFPLVLNVGQYGSYWGSLPLPVIPGGFVGPLAIIPIGLGGGWLVLRGDLAGTGRFGRLGGMALLLSAILEIVAIGLPATLNLPVVVGVTLGLLEIGLLLLGSVLVALVLLLDARQARLPAVLVIIGATSFLPVDPTSIDPVRAELQIAALAAFGIGWAGLGWLSRRSPSSRERSLS